MFRMLTLTQQDRQAIDWVGGRYSHGDDLRKLLCSECSVAPDEEDWDSPHDLVFVILENTAWRIRDMVEEDNLACFSDELAGKLRRLVGGIV